jgi:hypothetical protein
MPVGGVISPSAQTNKQIGDALTINYIMNYENFLFSQLFMWHVVNNETQYQELEYDLIFPEVLKHQNLFLKSNYNVDVRSEYDCIVDYLLNEVR